MLTPALVITSMFALAPAAPPDAPMHGAKASPQQLAQVLGVDTATANQVSEILARDTLKQQALGHAIQTSRREIRMLLVSGSTDDAAYTKLMEAMNAGRQQQQDLRKARQAELQKLLRPHQMARLGALAHPKKMKKHHERGQRGRRAAAPWSTEGL